MSLVRPTVAEEEHGDGMPAGNNESPAPSKVKRKLIRGAKLTGFDVSVNVLAGMVILLILVPVLAIVLLFFGNASAWQAVVAVVNDPELPEVLLNTLVVIGGATLVSTVVACVLAWLNERTNCRMGWLSNLLPVMSLLVPAFASAIGWVLLAAPSAGLLNTVIAFIKSETGIALPELNIFSLGGLIFLYSLYMIPQIYLTVGASLRNLDSSLEEAATISGAGILETLRRVILPVVRPAIVSGILLAVIYGVAMFAVPIIIGTQAKIEVLTVKIVRMLVYVYPAETEQAIVLSIFMVVLVGGLTALNARVSRSKRHATISGKPTTESRTILPRPMLIFSRALMILYIGLTCLLPLAALFFVSLQPYWSGTFAGPFSLDNYAHLFNAASHAGLGLRNSVGLGIFTATLAMAIALLLAYRIFDRATPKFGRFIDLTTKLPGALSHIVVAVGLLIALGGPPLRLSGTLTLLFIAYLVMYIPQATASAQSAILQVGPDLTEAAYTSGQGPLGTLKRITLPLSVPGLLAGWAFMFVLVSNDLTASVMLAGTNSPVVGFVVVDMFQNGTYPILSALATLISIVAIAIVVAALSLGSKRRKN